MMSAVSKFAVAISLAVAPVAGMVQSAPPAGQAAPATPAPAASGDAPQALAAPSYRIGKGDVIEIALVGREDYRARVQVQDDGTVLLPLINSVNVLNKTALETRELVSERLQSGGFYVKPAVNVTVVSYASRYVTVLGLVGTPGVVAIDRAYRLSEVIARAGGITNVAATTITVTGRDGQPRDYNLAAIATGGPGEDPLIGDGDKIFVAPAKTFYIYGQVGAPGNYPIEPGMTVRMALARAGGLTPLGSEKKVKLIRGEAESRANLASPIAPGDVIVIGERFF